MAKRIITALIGIPLFLGALYFGGSAWLGVIALLTALGAVESARLGFIGPLARFRPLGAIAAFAVAVGAYIGGGGGGTGAIVVGGATLAFTLWLAQYALRQPAMRHGEILWRHALMVCLYPAAYFAHLGLLRDEGLGAALLPVLVTWATDTAAFVTGSAIGKRPLVPRISPNKTVEGALGGLLFGVAVAAVWGQIIEGAALVWAGIGVAASVAAQAGDLIESGLKRKAGVKDSGALLPGHGGVLDRFDSLMISGTVVYYLLRAMR